MKYDAKKELDTTIPGYRYNTAAYNKLLLPRK
jgi:hypothetical protein